MTGPWKANNQDPLFNFTSYLRRADGCKLILWQRAATVPIRGSILSESALWHQEQLQGGQRKVTAEMRLNVQKQESRGPAVSRLKLIYKSLRRKKRAQRSSLRCWWLHRMPWKQMLQSLSPFSVIVEASSGLLDMLLYAGCLSITVDFVFCFFYSFTRKSMSEPLKQIQFSAPDTVASKHLQKLREEVLTMIPLALRCTWKCLSDAFGRKGQCAAVIVYGDNEWTQWPSLH